MGDSHVGTIKKGCLSTSLGYFNFKLPEDEIIFDFCYKGGAKTRQMLPGSNNDNNHLAVIMQQAINNFQPHAVLLCIGNNDVLKGDETSEMLALRIFNTAMVLLRRNVSISFFSILQLLPRYPGARGDVAAYNAAAAYTNRVLLDLCTRGPRAVHFSIVRFKFPSMSEVAFWNAQRLFNRGGVHLNLLGLRKLMFRLRYIIVLILRFLR